MNYILPGIYFFISMFSFYFAWKGFSTKKVLFKKGVMGTKLEHSLRLAYVQAGMMLLIAFATLLYGYIALLSR